MLSHAVDDTADRTEQYSERAGDEDAEQRALIGVRRKHHRPEESGAEADPSNYQGTSECGRDNPRKGHRALPCALLSAGR
jgi:hypothetical protein